jgi:hypothetical protein
VCCFFIIIRHFHDTEEEMKSKKWLFIIASLLLISMLLTACGGSQETTVAEENPVATQESSAPEEIVASEPSEDSGVPEDVPMIPDAYDLQVSNKTRISYKVDKTVQEVVEFYQSEFENYGWTVVKNPDSVVGNMAQMSRSNEAGDRLIFSLQYNPIGEFTVVQISITRAP